MEKVKLILNEQNIIVGYQISPITELDKTYIVDLNKLRLNFSYVNILGNIVYNEEAYQIDLEKKNKIRHERMLRAKREKIWPAFDKWEKAVLRGREVDDPAIMAWYQDLKDLKETAFENIPDRVDYYLRPKSKAGGN